MKIRYDTAFEPDEEFGMKNSEYINAKKLFVLFMDTYAPFDSLLDVQDDFKVFQEAVAELLGSGYADKVGKAVENFPWDICRCFYKFIVQCPQVHITID